MAIKNSLETKEIARPRRNGQPTAKPAWEVATLFPEQGDWSEEDYLALPGNRLVELSDGCLEVLPMPTTLHQWIVLYLCRVLDDFAYRGRLGVALPSPLRVRLWTGKFREPDVVFMLSKNRHRDHEV